jgi:hypothetical protein
MAIDSWLAAEELRDGEWVHLGTSMTQLTQAWCGLHRLAEAAFDTAGLEGLTDRTRAAAAEYFDAEDAGPAPHWLMLPALRRALAGVDPAATPTAPAVAAAAEHFADPEHTECLGDVRQLVAMLELGDDPDEPAIRILAWWGY